MNKGLLITIATIAVLAFAIGVPSCSYNNKFVAMDQSVEQSWAEVQNQYQRRSDLIPNLVNVVKGYAAHESETLQGVTNARAGLSKAYNEAKAIDATSANADEQSLEKYTQAQSQLKGALDIYVNAVREAYPDLKANQNFIGLQTQLEGTENRITVARKAYTEQVASYNVSVKQFPGRIFAAIFGYDAKPQFKADTEAQQAPVVEF